MRDVLVRIVFDLDPDAWHSTETERLWGLPVGAGRYRLLNTPFYAFGVSCEDVVFAELRGDQLYFSGVSIRGGHSSYRIRLCAGAELNLHPYWEALQRLGCTHEEGPVLAIDVPRTVHIPALWGLLEAGEAAGIWEFEEGHCGHPRHRHYSSEATGDST